MKKHTLHRVIATSILVLLALISVFSLTGCSWQLTIPSEDDSLAPFYPDRVVTVQFVMAEDDWTYLKERASEESYVQADMLYDGELVPDIALRPKGNSSLTSTINSGSIKFGLKADLNFFNEARSLDGVKKLNFNNGWSDPTFLREILSYELFAQMGLPTPRASFVDVYVNDIHLGLYTMVEQIDQTFLTQYFTDTSGNLYKPEIPAGYLNWTEDDIDETLLASLMNTSDVNIGGGNLNEILEALGLDATSDNVTAAAPVMPGGGFNFGVGNLPTDNVTPPAGPGFGNQPQFNPPFSGNVSDNFTRPNTVLPGAGMVPGAGMRLGASGNLIEQIGLKTNENKPNYTALFHLLDILNNSSDEVFAAEIENVLDVDQMLRYLAVSAVLVHLDNYTGMGHNYYLYEVDGKFTIIPWDLNMSFGNFNASLDQDGIINFLIDEPTSGAVAERPFVARLLAVPEYLEKYHEYIEEMINGCFSPEVMNSRIDEIAEMIRPYVKVDTEKFYSYKAFESFIGEGTLSDTGARGAGMGLNIGLKTFIVERIESVKKQLVGELPSTNNGQGNGGNTFMGGNNFNRINPGQ